MAHDRALAFLFAVVVLTRYYWDSGKERTIRNDTFVQAGHMSQGILVPAGTKVSMRTEREATPPLDHEAQVLVTLPDGRRFASFAYPGATQDGLWLWAALYALTVNELPPESPTRTRGLPTAGGARLRRLVRAARSSKGTAYFSAER
jgi:hypothetical protein